MATDQTRIFFNDGGDVNLANKNLDGTTLAVAVLKNSILHAIEVNLVDTSGINDNAGAFGNNSTCDWIFQIDRPGYGVTQFRVLDNLHLFRNANDIQLYTVQQFETKGVKFVFNYEIYATELQIPASTTFRLIFAAGNNDFTGSTIDEFSVALSISEFQ